MLRLKTYIFEHPSGNEVATIDPRSYVYAGLFGAFYVLFRGFVGRFLLALMVNVLFVLIGLLTAGAIASILPSTEASVALVVVTIALMGARARPIIAIVRAGYQARGWSITRLA